MFHAIYTFSYFDCLKIPLLQFEPCSEKTCFMHICKNKGTDQLHSDSIAKQCLCFIYIYSVVQSLYFPNPKFKASGHLLWLYSSVYVRPGKKPRRRRSSFEDAAHLSRVMRNQHFFVSDLLRHKPGCTATEDGQRRKISVLGSREIVLSM